MSDRGLQALSPLGGFVETIGAVTLSEVSRLAVVAVAVPLGRQAEVQQALTDASGLDWALPGMSSMGKGGVRLLGMARDQGFLMFAHDGPGAVTLLADRIGAAAWLTDQSDSWATLRVSGDRCRDALERICMLDLNPAVFGVGAVHRTTMEHLAVIILREDVDTFLLMSPTSSAESFLDAVVTSARNILPAA